MIKSNVKLKVTDREQVLLSQLNKALEDNDVLQTKYEKLLNECRVLKEIQLLFHQKLHKLLKEFDSGS